LYAKSSVCAVVCAAAGAAIASDIAMILRIDFIGIVSNAVQSYAKTSGMQNKNARIFHFAFPSASI
jgi:hypothetical protein